jgi:hypothetical protein
MDTQPQPLTKERLAALLREAEHAHGQYEAQLGHRDDDWPDWYAAYMVSKLQEQQTPTPTPTPTQSQSLPPAHEPSP